MFKRTRSVLNYELNNIKRFAFGVNLFAQVVYVAYLVLSIVLNSGMLWSKIALLVVSIAYFVFFVVTNKRLMTDDEKDTRNKWKKLYGYSKKVINFLVIAISIVQLCLYPNEHSTINILLTMGLTLVYIATIFIDVFVGKIKTEAKTIFTAIQLDLEEISPARPINFVREKVGLVVYKKEHNQKIVENIDVIVKEQMPLIKEEKKFKKEQKKLRKIKFRKECQERHIEKKNAAKEGNKNKQLVVKKEKYEITYEQAYNALMKNSTKAKEVLNSKSKTDDLLIKAEETLKKVPQVVEGLSNFFVFIQLIRAYVNKEYTAVPTGTIIAATCAVLYVVLPTDLISDAIPGFGYLDDAAVATICYNLIKHDLEEFKQWREICAVQ